MKGTEGIRKIAAGLGKYRYVLLVVLVGVLLLAWPAGEEKEAAAQPEAGRDIFQVEQLEKKLEKALSQVEGAGEVTVALTVKNGTERVPLTDRSTAAGEREDRVEEKAVVINTGSGQQTVVRLERAPVFQGAVVVSQGGDRAEVRLLLTQAVSSLTGLGADKITICKGG